MLSMQAAEELGCSIFVHPWDMPTDGRMAKYWLPWLVGEGAGTEDNDPMKEDKSTAIPQTCFVSRL